MIKKILIMSLVLKAAAVASITPPSEEAIIINGESMDYDTNKNKSTVVGNARAERGSGAQKHILTAKKFDVYFRNKTEKTEKTETTSTGGNDIEEIQAIGDAVLVKEADKLTVKADYCFYRPGEGKEVKANTSGKIEFIECQSNVRLNKAGHYLEGDKAVINIDTGVYKVTSNKRVRGILKQEPRVKSTPEPSKPSLETTA